MKKIVLSIACLLGSLLTSAQTGAALNFSGGGDFVQLADPNYGTSNFTLETWIKPNATNGAYLISTRTNEFGAAGNWFVLSYNAGKIGFELSDEGFGSGYFETAGTPVTLSAWNHVALVRSGLQFSIYVNGILSASYTDTGLRNFNTGANSIRLSGWADVGVAFFNGMMDETRFWNVARTACQINTFMNCEIPTTATGLIGNYHFNQGVAAGTNSGVTSLTDVSGSSRTGTLNNFSLTGSASNWITPGGVVSGFTTALAPPVITVSSGVIGMGTSYTMTPGGGVSYTYTPSGPVVSPTVMTSYTVTGTAVTGCTNTAVSTVSIQGSALNFDGSNDFISIGSVISLGSSYTKEAWIYANASGSNNIISSNSAAFWVAGGQLRAFNNGGPTVIDPATFPLNQWVHVAVTLNAANGVLSLYKNGVLATTGVSNPGNNNDAMAIGQYGPTGANFFQGSIDEVRIWNVVRTQCEINTFRSCEIPTTATGLIANYHFNQGFNGANNSTITSLTDASSNSNTGTLNNFALTGTTSNWIAPSAITNNFATPLTLPTSILTTTNVACNGGTSGSIVATTSGGTPSYTYLWSTGAITSSITSMVAGIYTRTVTDVNSCSSISTATITQPSALVTSTAVTNVACNGGSNGVAAITASGGTPSYTYLWSNGATTSAATGLLAGAYTATVTDANSCKSIKNATVTQPSALVTSTAVTNVACNGGSNGVAAITASGGTTAYTYLWSNGATTSAATGLLAGAYTATVTDANSCTSIKVATVTQPSALVTTTAVTSVACNGGSNGIASITASGGTTAYTYLWSNGATTSSITGLLAGAYTATVTDANSCKSIKVATVTQPSALVTTTAVTNVACNGGSNGVASITASGGTTTYTYLWSNGVTTSAATGLLAGAYTATVTDANSCKSIKNVTVTQPSVLTSNSTSSNILCNGGVSTINVTATGGTASYLGVGTFTAMAGIQTYTVTDANGCSTTTSVSVTEPTALVANSTATSILCNGGMSTVNVTATGGTASYSGVGTYTAMAGTQTYTVTDANGCSTTTSVSVTEPTALVANSTATSILCNGGMSTVNVTATGGTASYSGVGTYTAMAGTETYTVTDVNGCSTTTSVSITEPAVLIANSTATSILCNGGMSTVNVTAIGGTASYSGVGTYTAMAGTETYTVTDANGCSTTTSVSITEPAAIVNSQTVTLCNGQSVIVGTNTYTSGGTYTDVITSQLNGCDSTITTDIIINILPTISVNSGAICAGQSFTMIPSGAVTYTYSNGTDVVTPTADATYSVSGTDANGCVSNVDAVSSVTVNVLPVLTISTTNTLLCTGETATLSVTGATSYTWSTTETTSDIAVTPAVQTTYTVDATDANGCANSTTIMQDVSLCTGVVTLNAIEASLISVYPNPNNGLFTVDLVSTSKVIVTNALGQIVIAETMEAGKHSLDIHNQSTGIYFVKVIVDGKQHVIKLIKE